MTSPDPLIRLLPFQVVTTGAGVVLRRGALRVALDGAGVAEAIARLQEVASEAFCRRSDLLDLFAPLERDKVNSLLRELAVRRLLELRGDEPSVAPPHLETQQDIFFWQLGITKADVHLSTTTTVALVGVNRLSLALRDNLTSYGNWEIVLIDDIPLRNQDLFESGQSKDVPFMEASTFMSAVKDCRLVVACAEFGGIGLLKPWNRLSVETGTAFLPILIEDMTMKLGPLTIPDETACLECLDARQNSHLKPSSEDRHLEAALAVGGESFSGGHPALLAAAAAIAAFEILRFCANMAPRRIGKLIEMNLVSTSMFASKVLKVPRCPVCSPMKHAGKLTLEKVQPNKERWEEIEAMGAPRGN